MDFKLSFAVYDTGTYASFMTYQHNIYVHFHACQERCPGLRRRAAPQADRSKSCSRRLDKETKGMRRRDIGDRIEAAQACEYKTAPRRNVVVIRNHDVHSTSH